MTNFEIRKAVVAGQFYPSSSQGIKKQIEAFIDKNVNKQDIIACMLPHAGYMYSGRVAAQTLAQINIKDKVILLGPNHTGYGAAFSIMTQGLWQTPIGEIKIDSSLAGQILKNSEFLEEDSSAHMHEHSLEVELPILQYFRPKFEIVPIAFLSDDIERLKKTGEHIAAVINNSGIKDSCLLVASSDMTHYEPQGAAEKKDKIAIQAILELDADKLVENIQRLNISMCGYAPAIVMIEAVKKLGAKITKLVKYQTSGDVTGDKDSVVGYAGIIIY